jgi:ubiquitin-conjugating enzyme E2 variant
MSMTQQPYFTESTPHEERMMWMFVGGNFLVMLGCGGYVVAAFGAAGVTWPAILAAVVVGWFVADFSSGLVHWGLDTWFDERSLGRAVAIAREHHTHPQHILGYRFIEHSALGSAPSVVLVGAAAALTALLPVSVAAWCAMVVWLITASCLFFGTSFHNLAHKPSRSALIRFGQWIGLLIRPEEHWAHHRGDQTIRYCVINGWANRVCDPLCVWRMLERLVQALTGAAPRRDDLVWQRRYKETGTLFEPPRPLNSTSTE